ncbi:MAG: sulfate ABC transporter permease subunit CysT [Gemmataceae bacterium]
MWRRAIARRSFFSLSAAVTLAYMSLLLFMPLAAGVLAALQLEPAEFWRIVAHPRVLSAYRVIFLCSGLAAIVNGLIGLVVAWVLVRYEFVGKRLLDALVDLPLALPTAVAGLTFASLYSPTGWLGQHLTALEPDGCIGRIFAADGVIGRFFGGWDIRLHDGALAIVVVLLFVGFPFVVRAVQPVLAELEPEQEEAAASLGASRGQTFRYVILPYILPAWLTGMALAFARGLGEYGAVVFVASNLPYRTEIPAVLVVASLEQFQIAEAAVVALGMMLLAFMSLLAIQLLERWSRRHEANI